MRERKLMMRKRLKSTLLACLMAGALVVGTAPSMACAEDFVGGRRRLAFLRKRKAKQM